MVATGTKDVTSLTEIPSANLKIDRPNVYTPSMAASATTEKNAAQYGQSQPYMGRYGYALTKSSTGTSADPYVSSKFSKHLSNFNKNTNLRIPDNDDL